MKLHINIRGNGACPLCAKDGNCVVQMHLSGSVEGINNDDAHGLEIVVYRCPQFVENGSTS